MTKFILRRLLMSLISLLIASFVIYAAMYLAPGNPVTLLGGGHALPQSSIRILDARYHLNQPLLTQYWDWLSNVFHGDLGVSIVQHASVASLIGPRLGVTAELVLYAGILVVVVGIPLGLVGGLWRGLPDTITLTISTVLVAAPSFVVALLLISVFSIGLGWFPALGDGIGFFDQLQHLTLPAIALAASSLALVSRVTRASVREEMAGNHVQTAVSRAIPRSQVLRRHVMRNAAIPITTVVGVTVASLIATAAIVEQAFALNGVGAELITSADSKDFAVVQAISLILITAFIATNAFVDILYAALDPRVKLGERAA